MTSLICCEIEILYKPIAKLMGNGKFRPPQLRNRLTDFDEIRTLELGPEDHPPCKISFRSDDGWYRRWYWRIPILLMSLKRQWGSCFPR